MPSLIDIPFEDASGQTQTLSAYKGNVVLLVNVASKCGFTKQYAGLQKLQDTYAERGFTVLGFPSNDFLRQEPGTNEEIQEFCRMNFGVTFPVLAKISVKGKEQHALYAFLTSKETNPEFAGKITWNFNKFLIDQEGQVIGRFGSRTKPLSDEITSAIEAALSPSE